VTTISTCNFLSEYSVVGPVNAGATYQFTTAPAGYITVREGSATGAVVAEGMTQVSAVPTVSGSLYVHWNVDASCATSSSGCIVTTVQLFLNCTPPVATVTAVDDCDNNQFTLNVNVTSIGDGTGVDLIYNVNGGADQTVAGVQVGMHPLGPFTVGETVNLVVAHSSDPACNLSFNGLVSGNTCPTLVTCGDPPLDQTYCYINNDNNHWHYEATTPGLPLIIIFSGGSIESNSWDHLRIYDGADNSGTLLWENGSGTTQLAGLQFVAASGHLYMQNTSDGSVSCQSGSQTQWNWQVGCLDCVPATASYNVVTDCDNYNFMVEVHITDLGSDQTLDIAADSLGNVLATATDTGVYTVGPFTANVPVVFILSNSDNPLCNVTSTPLVNPLCPQVIQCGGAPVDGQYCYTNNDSHAWSWQSSGGESLILIFSAGSIGTNTTDHLRIYDGPDNLSPLIYENPTGTTTLGGLQVVAASGMMYMEMSSDAFGSCSSGSYAEWFWQVGCLDCTPPVATYNVVTDCDNYSFMVEVHITGLGSDQTLDITADSLSNVLATATDTGVYSVGPFTANIPVVITLSNDENSLCNVSSDPLVNPLCPQVIQCGGAPVDESYCYVPNDNHAWSWQSSAGEPLILIFSAGAIESNTWDDLIIYDGPDALSPILYQNPTGTTQLAGLQVIAPSGQIYMTVTSDGSVSCATNTSWTWVWQVGCLDCTQPVATYNVVTDCDNYNFMVEVHITDLGSDQTLDITADSLGNVLATATDTGMYVVGPFTANIPVVITLSNDENSLCNVSSAPLVNPLCPQVIQCGGAPVDGSYCYVNNDNHAWHWQSSGNEALIIIFSAGAIESATFDQLTIYDGPDDQSPVLYQNPTGTTTQLAGLQVIAPSGHMFMKVTSESSVSCETNSGWTWAWQVGCLDCTAPAATFTVVTDCANMQYSVDVNLTSLGSDDVIDITNDNGALPVAASAPGTFTVGPFAAGTTTVITLVNDMNTLCNVSSQPLINPLCPTVVECGGALLQETYCYSNSDSHTWHWQASGSSPLAMQFTAGTIESNTWDQLRIYDGPDNLSPLLYQNPAGTTDLTDLLLIASSGHIYMELTSDGSVSCSTDSTWTWDWNIGCLDCTNPGATFSIVEDCIHHSFTVAVNVDSLGSGSFVRIANTLTTDTLTNIPTGITMVGPFPMDSTVMVTVLNETNDLCRVFSPDFTSDSQACVDTVCAATAYEYCYTNSDTAWFAYQGMPGVPLTVSFLWGNLGANDFVQIYNGFAPLPANLVWQGNLNGNLAGWAVNTTQGYSDMLLRIVSNDTYSCATGQAALPLHWVVECGAVGVGETAAGTFSMYPNPTTGELTIKLPTSLSGTVDMRVSDLTGRTVHHEAFTAGGAVNVFDLHGLQSGNYVVTLSTNGTVMTQGLQIIH